MLQVVELSSYQCSHHSIYPDPHPPRVHTEDGHHRRVLDEHTDQTWGIENMMSWSRPDNVGPGGNRMTDRNEGPNRMDLGPTTIQFCSYK